MKSEKQKKKRGIFGTLFGVIGTVILTLLLAAIGLTAYLLISMKRDPVVTRTLQEYAQTEPDPSFEHLSFTEEGYMTQTYSEEDIGFFIAKYLDKEKIDPWSLLEEVPVSDLSLKGFDIRLENGGAVVCAEGAWRSIRLTARALLNIDADKGTIILSPDAVKLAGIRIPVSLIDRFFKTDIADQSLSYAPETVLLSEIARASAEDGKISFTGPMATEFLDYNDLSENRIRMTRLCQKDYAFAAATLDTEGADPAERYAVILPDISEEADTYNDYLDKLFCLLSGTAVRKTAMYQNNFGMALRWFPETYEYSYNDRRPKAYDEYYVCFRQFKTISAKIAGDYSSGRLRIGKDKVTYNGKAFSFEDYFGSNYRFYRPFLEMDGGRMCTARRQKGSSANAAMLLRGKDGCGFLVVIYRAENYSIIPVREDAFLGFMASDTVPEILLSDTAQFTGKTQW